MALNMLSLNMRNRVCCVMMPFKECSGRVLGKGLMAAAATAVVTVDARQARPFKIKKNGFTIGLCVVFSRLVV